MKKIFILFVILFSGCALSPIQSDMKPIVSVNNEAVNVVGSGTILLFNDAGFMHKFDITDRVNIWIDGLAIGQLESEEFVIIKTDIGEATFKVVHLDLKKWETTHSISIDQDTKYIRISPTITSNLVEIVKSLPEDFNDYKYME